MHLGWLEACVRYGDRIVHLFSIFLFFKHDIFGERFVVCVGIFQMPRHMSYCTSWRWRVPRKNSISSCIAWWGCFGFCSEELWLLFLQVIYAILFYAYNLIGNFVLVSYFPFYVVCGCIVIFSSRHNTWNCKLTEASGRIFSCFVQIKIMVEFCLYQCCLEVSFFLFIRTISGSRGEVGLNICIYFSQAYTH